MIFGEKLYKLRKSQGLSQEFTSLIPYCSEIRMKKISDLLESNI